MPTIFSKIIAGEIPCFKVAENQHFIAFLDISPLKKGHMLVVPKVEVDYLFDLEASEYTALMNFAKRVAVAIKSSIECKRVSMHVIGLEVPHAHIHLIPINTPDDCNFSNEKLKLSKEALEEIAKNISANFK